MLEAGEAIASLGDEWALALPDYQRDILHTLFEDVQVDPVAAQLISLRPYPEFRVLFELAGEEVRDGRVQIEPAAAEG